MYSTRLPSSMWPVGVHTWPELAHRQSDGHRWQMAISGSVHCTLDTVQWTLRVHKPSSFLLDAWIIIGLWIWAAVSDLGRAGGTCLPRGRCCCSSCGLRLGLDWRCRESPNNRIQRKQPARLNSDCLRLHTAGKWPMYCRCVPSTHGAWRPHIQATVTCIVLRGHASAMHRAFATACVGSYFWHALDVCGGCVD